MKLTSETTLITQLPMTTTEPNVVVEWLALHRIRENPDSNFGQETGYPDRGSLWFSSVPSCEHRDIIIFKLGIDRFLPIHPNS
jgi:hypothetical protein